MPVPRHQRSPSSEMDQDGPEGSDGVRRHHKCTTFIAKDSPEVVKNNVMVKSSKDGLKPPEFSARCKECGEHFESQLFIPLQRDVKASAPEKTKTLPNEKAQLATKPLPKPCPCDTFHVKASGFASMYWVNCTKCGKAHHDRFQVRVVLEKASAPKETKKTPDVNAQLATKPSPQPCPCDTFHMEASVFPSMYWVNCTKCRKSHYDRFHVGVVLEKVSAPEITKTLPNEKAQLATKPLPQPCPCDMFHVKASEFSGKYWINCTKCGKAHHDRFFVGVVLEDLRPDDVSASKNGERLDLYSPTVRINQISSQQEGNQTVCQSCLNDTTFYYSQRGKYTKKRCIRCIECDDSMPASEVTVKLLDCGSPKKGSSAPGQPPMGRDPKRCGIHSFCATDLELPQTLHCIDCGEAVRFRDVAVELDDMFPVPLCKIVSTSQPSHTTFDFKSVCVTDLACAQCKKTFQCLQPKVMLDRLKNYDENDKPILSGKRRAFFMLEEGVELQDLPCQSCHQSKGVIKVKVEFEMLKPSPRRNAVSVSKGNNTTQDTATQVPATRDLNVNPQPCTSWTFCPESDEEAQRKARRQAVKKRPQKKKKRKPIL